MNKKDIIQAVRDYLNNEKAKYAIMIIGTWGCGKTYLYEKDLLGVIQGNENGKNERKPSAYISLYGMSKIEDLTKEIGLNYMLNNVLKEEKITENIYKGVGKVTGILSKIIETISIKGISIKLEKMSGIIKDIVNFKNMVICFDDLERCNIPINEIFGIINNLVEHCECKVIILADEENIGKMYANNNLESKYLTILNGRKLIEEVSTQEVNMNTKNNTMEDITITDLKAMNEKVYSENYIYKDIKEKVIGITIMYTPNLAEEYDSIVEDAVNSKELIEILQTNKGKILSYMNEYNNQNIRIMRIWAINFERVYKVIKNNYDKTKYFDYILQEYIRDSIRAACCVSKNKDLRKWEKGEKIANHKTSDSFFSYIEIYKFMDDLYKYSTLMEDEVCFVVQYIINKIEEENKRNVSRGECLYKLQKWNYLEDEEVEPLVIDLVEEIKEEKYRYQDYQSIVATLVMLKEKNLYTKDLKIIINAMKKNINNEKKEIEVENIGQYFTIDQKGFDSFDLYHELYDPLYESMLLKNKEADTSQISELLINGGPHWAVLFSDFCEKHENEFLKKKGFFTYLDINLLSDKIREATPKEIYDVEGGLKRVYSFGNLDEFYYDDRYKLSDFKEMLENHNPTTITRKIAIEALIATVKAKYDIITKEK